MLATIKLQNISSFSLYNIIALYRRRAAAFPVISPDQTSPTHYSIVTHNARNIFRFHCTTQNSVESFLLLTIVVSAVTTSVACTARCCCIFIVQLISGVCSQANVFWFVLVRSVWIVLFSYRKQTQINIVRQLWSVTSAAAFRVIEFGGSAFTTLRCLWIWQIFRVW